MKQLKDAISALESGDLATAEHHCRQALALSPQSPEAWNLLGIVAGRVGKHDVAAKLMQQSVAIAPAKAGFRSNLATALLSLDRTEEAESSLREGLRHCPNDAKLNALLATSFGKQGRIDEAIAAMTKAISLGANDAFTHFNLAELYRRNDQLDAAVTHFSRAVELEPNYTDALNNLAGIFLDRGDYLEAMRAIQRSLDVNPRSAQAYTNLGVVMFAAGEMEQSLVAVRNAIRINPECERSRFQLANMLIAIGHIEEAATIVEELRAEFPEDPVYTAVFAKIQERKGDLEGAANTMEGLTEVANQNPSVAMSAAVILAATGKRKQAIRTLREVIAQDEAVAHESVGLHFSLGEMLDKEGEYDSAFEHFRLGNKNRRKAFFKPKNQHGWPDVEIVQGLMERSTLDAWQNVPTSNSQETPIFIVGMPRSGTSLTEQILASHSKVFGAGELRLMQQEIARSHESTSSEKQNDRPFEIVDFDGTKEQSGFTPREWPQTPVAVLDAIANAYMAELRKLDSEATYFTDKMPYNFFVLPIIAKVFPQAKIIHTRRHPLDTCLSCYFQNFTGGHQYAYDLKDLGEFYSQYRLWMHYCRHNLKIAMLEMDYEDVVRDPINNVKRLVDYCGLPWEDTCLEFHKSKRIVRTASYQQVRNPIYTRSVDRWKNYAKHLRPLMESLGHNEEDFGLESP